MLTDPLTDPLTDVYGLGKLDDVESRSHHLAAACSDNMCAMTVL